MPCPDYDEADYHHHQHCAWQGGESMILPSRNQEKVVNEENGHLRPRQEVLVVMDRKNVKQQYDKKA